MIELEFGLRILPRAGEMGKSTARDDGDPLRPRRDDLPEGSAQRLAAPGGWQRRQIRVDENRNHRNLAAFHHEFKDRGESVPEDGVLRIHHVEARRDQPVEEILAKRLMNRNGVRFAGKGAIRVFASNHGKRGNRREEKRFEMIAAEDHHNVRLRFIQGLA